MYLDLTGVQIICEAATPATFGLLYGRPASLGSSDQHNSYGAHVYGAFSIANVIEIGSERNVWVAPHFENTSTSATAAAWYRGANVPTGVVTAFTAPVAVSDGLNTTGLAIGGQVYASGDGVAAVIDDVDEFSMVGTNFYAANNKTIELRNGCRSVVLLNNRQEVFTTGAAGPGNGTMTMHLATAGTYYGIQLIGGALAGGETDWTIYGEDGAVLRALNIRGTNLTISYEGIDVDELHDSEIHGAGFIDHTPTKVNVRTSCSNTKFSHCDVTLPAGSVGIEEFPLIEGSATWNPPSLAAGAQQTTTVTATGAALGYFADNVSFSLDLQGATLTAYVSAADTVTVVHRNGTAGAVDLGSGTLRVRVRKVY
jgi:hypothetical protein